MPFDQIRDLTDRRRFLHPMDWIVEELNRFLRGWAAYFRYGKSADQFDKINRYARIRMAISIAQRHRLPQLRLVHRGLRLGEPTRMMWESEHQRLPARVGGPGPIPTSLQGPSPASNGPGRQRLELNTDEVERNR
jgi:hypothetical protein